MAKENVKSEEKPVKAPEVPPVKAAEVEKKPEATPPAELANMVEPKPPVEAPKDEALKTALQLRAIHGVMVDPHTGERYTQRAAEYTEITPWVQAQIDAKKIETT